jgi:predicted ATP-binding protein involved in virulence
LSSGEQSLLLFLIDVHIRRDTTTLVLIDEVDAHLHVAWQMDILPTLQRLLPDAQIICTTHQPLVLDSVPPKCRFKLPSPGEQSPPPAEPKHESVKT